MIESKEVRRVLVVGMGRETDAALGSDALTRLNHLRTYKQTYIHSLEFLLRESAKFVASEARIQQNLALQSSTDGCQKEKETRRETASRAAGSQKLSVPRAHATGFDENDEDDDIVSIARSLDRWIDRWRFEL
ncbi:hypothetical protein AXG93_2097s1040 [Marchantia polymorpha subsp. ruderalis]|uniref:Uncharacterized protein n=1 Tax=Marchantia polymorpha subsp. ruderalis TaxID=1480154 RepID=A0A176W3Q7_MARPO|nr:hypothetical protein AXG93_2097s1040 [Marchantia polymorpha subsp. ruderalis]